MPARHLPVRPDLTQLRHQAKDLLKAFRRGDPEAIADFQQFHPDPVTAGSTKLADAQLVLARSYQSPSWPRLVMACHLVDAIWQNDLDQVVALIERQPQLLHENALVRESNWGRPLAYAANLGRDQIVRFLHSRGATDLEHGLDRASLQGRIETARMIHDLMGKPRVGTTRSGAQPTP